jgi:hypothetical protein
MMSILGKITDAAIRNSNEGALLFLLAIIFCLAGWGVLTFVFKVINRIVRHRTIVKMGWPPPHLDADGNAIGDPEE